MHGAAAAVMDDEPTADRHPQRAREDGDERGAQCVPSCLERAGRRVSGEVKNKRKTMEQL